MPASRPRTVARSEKPKCISTGATRLIAFTVPGLAALLAEELQCLAGVRVEDSGHDGRADVVLFTVEHPLSTTSSQSGWRRTSLLKPGGRSGLTATERNGSLAASGVPSERAGRWPHALR
jgi:hypothetical protein